MSHLTLDQSDCFKRLPTAINQSTSLCFEQMKLNDSEPCDFGSFYCIETEMICSSVFFGGPLGSWEPRIHVFHSIQPPLLAPVKQPGLVPKLLDLMTTPKKKQDQHPPGWRKPTHSFSHPFSATMFFLCCVSEIWTVSVLYEPAFHPTIWANLFKTWFFWEEKQGVIQKSPIFKGSLGPPASCFLHSWCQAGKHG